MIWLTGLLFLLAGLLLLSACAGREAAREEIAGSIDLIDTLRRVNPELADKNLNRNLPVIRKGLRKETLTFVAPKTLRVPLSGAAGLFFLKGSATPVFNIGDGVQLDLYLGRSGGVRNVGTRYFNPGRRAEDRDWISFQFPVEVSKGDHLEIAVSAGPRGDLVADWLAFSSLRLVPRKAGP